jgi:hypothetical protein
MTRKLSNKIGLENRNDGKVGHATGLVSIVRNAFRFNHHIDSSASRINTEVSLVNSDLAAMRQAETLLRRTRMLQ